MTAALKVDEVFSEVPCGSMSISRESVRQWPLQSALANTDPRLGS